MHNQRHKLCVRWLCLVLCAWPMQALAAPRVALENFRGPAAGTVRATVMKVLKAHGIEVVPPGKFKKVARSVGAELDTESGRVRVAKKLHLNAFVSGRMKAAQKRIQISIIVYGGSDGMQAAEFTATVPKTAAVKELQSKLWDEIGSAVQGGGSGSSSRDSSPDSDLISERSTPAKPEPTRAAPTRKPIEESDDQFTELETPTRKAPAKPERKPVRAARQEPEESEQEVDQESATNPEALALENQADQEEPTTKRPSAFDVAVGALLGTRDFGYRDSLPGLSVYKLPVSPSLALHAHWYPAAHFTSGVLAHIGLDVRADMLVGVSSEDKKNNQTFSTSAHGFGVGLRGRIPLAAHELGVVVGFNQRAFGLSSDKKIDAQVPDITHNTLRFGVDGRYQIFPLLAVQLRASYLYGLSLGQLSSEAWFPHASGNGLEAEVGLQLSMNKLLATELAFGLQRYFMSLNPERGDPSVEQGYRVAGGALDMYYSGRVSVVIRP